MCHTFKHLFICNTYCCPLILLLLSLYIELSLMCCTNPNNVNCFGTIFRNLNFVFASIWAARPVHIESDRPIQKLLNCQTRTCCRCYSIHPDWGATNNSAVALGSQNNMISIHRRSAPCYAWRMKAKQRWFKVTRELCHEWFHHFRHHVHDGHWTGEFATVIWCLHCFTVSFRGDVRGESGPR